MHTLRTRRGSAIVGGLVSGAMVLFATDAVELAKILIGEMAQLSDGAAAQCPIGFYSDVSPIHSVRFNTSQCC